MNPFIDGDRRFIPVGRPTGQEGIDLVADLPSIDPDRTGVGHDHIQLAGMDGQVAQYLKLIDHGGFVVLLDSRPQCILAHFAAETVHLQQFPHQMDALQSPVEIGRTAFELKIDVVLHGPVTHQRLGDGKMKPQAGLQAAIMLGYHKIVAIGHTGPHRGQQRLVLGGLKHH